MQNQSSITRKIIKVHATKNHVEQDVLATESPLQISISVPSANPSIHKKNISITMRTPGNDSELAVGFLFTEGIISDPTVIQNVHSEDDETVLTLRQNIKLNSLERNFYTSSSCGVCGKSSIDAIKTVCQLPLEKSAFKVESNLLYELPNKLRTQQQLFQSTGGIHAAALFSIDGDLLHHMEDVGRHNALDKLIGQAFLSQHLPLEKHIILLSGRASFELIQKAAMAGVQCILAVGAPSSLAVELAEEFDMTLVGFLSDHRFNIYTGEKRIKL